MKFIYPIVILIFLSMSLPCAASQNLSIDKQEILGTDFDLWHKNHKSTFWLRYKFGYQGNVYALYNILEKQSGNPFHAILTKNGKVFYSEEDVCLMPLDVMAPWKDIGDGLPYQEGLEKVYVNFEKWMDDFAAQISECRLNSKQSSVQDTSTFDDILSYIVLSPLRWITSISDMFSLRAEDKKRETMDANLVIGMSQNEIREKFGQPTAILTSKSQPYQIWWYYKKPSLEVPLLGIRNGRLEWVQGLVSLELNQRIKHLTCEETNQIDSKALAQACKEVKPSIIRA